MEHGNKEILPLDAVEERIARRNSLCQVAFPYLDGLYDFIRGSEFLLLFSDEESCKQKSIAEVKKVPQNLHS